MYHEFFEHSLIKGELLPIYNFYEIKVLVVRIDQIILFIRNYR